MHINDFDFDLPSELIAQHPLNGRTSSRLLKLSVENEINDLGFEDLVTELNPGDLLVINNTRVIPARLFGNKATGGAVEILIERIESERMATAHVRASKAPPVGSLLTVHGCQLKVVEREQSLFRLELQTMVWMDLLTEHGHMPLPPYIERREEQQDQERYQTVYAKQAGAIAAPTAGLHFDESLLKLLNNNGVGLAELTLHVGAGTFQPVRVDDLADHVMHFERVKVDQKAVDAIGATKAAGGKIVAVGTTVVRSLETAASSGELTPYDDETNLFIKPGYDFKIVDRLITNFHLPKSTLMMLVSAFAGIQEIKNAYQHAIDHRYRFFSYGDAMLLDKKT